MTDFADFRAVLDIWPTRESCASDIGASNWQVSKWWQRNSVPAEWWAPLLGTERARSAGITADLLTALAARNPSSSVVLAEARA